MGITPEGHLYVGYVDLRTDSLATATNADGSWTRQTALPMSEVFTPWDFEYAVDPQGKSHFCYQHADAYNLQYATNISGAWQTQTVDPNANSGAYSAIWHAKGTPGKSKKNRCYLC